MSSPTLVSQWYEHHVHKNVHEKQINGRYVCMFANIYIKKLQMLPYKCNQHTMNHLSSLLTLHIRLVHMFIT